LEKRVQGIKGSRIQVFGFLSYPSIVSDGIDTADLLICDIGP
jgi:hypothetical protein